LIKRHLIASLALILCASLSFVSNAYEGSFADRINQIDELKKSSPDQALEQIYALEILVPQTDIYEQISYYNIKAETLIDLGLYRQSKEASEYGLTLARDISSPSTLTPELFYNLGFANESLGDIELAERHYLEGLELAKSQEQQKQIALGLLNLGAIYYQTAQQDRSIIALQSALQISQHVNDDELSGSINSELGILYGQLGETEKAIEFYEKSFEHFIKIKSYISAYNNMRNLGVNYANAGNFDKSIESYQQIIDNQDLIKNSEIILSAYSGLAWAYARQEGDEGDEKAYQYLIEAGERIDKVEGNYLKLNYLIDRAWALDALKKYDDALDTLKKAEDMLTAGLFARELNHALRIKSLQALIHYDLGLYETAYQLLDEYSELEVNFRNNQRRVQVDELRLAYESEQVDIENKILENQAKIESLELAEANRASEHKDKFIIAMSLVVLVFAWVLYRIYRAQKVLLHVTRTDTLTGIINRRHILELGQELFIQSKELQQSYTVLSVDCDHFKKINDQFGHHVGDVALITLAKSGQNVIESPNIFGRISGEEFMVLMPGSNKQQGITLADKFRKTIENTQFHQGEMNLTISIGVAEVDFTKHHQFSDLMKVSDTFLYQAKHSGRNRVCA
jgi:diguanylate cyclase (GGDEF)-like protein